MVKRILFITLVIIFILSLNCILAEDYPATPFGLTPDDISDTADKIQSAPSYFEKDWITNMGDTFFGKTVLLIDKIFTAFSPIFEFILGVDYSMSWFFFLSLTIWIVVFLVIFRPIKEMFEGQTYVAVGIAVIIPTLAAQFGTIKMLAGFIEPLFKNIWVTILILLVIALLVTLYVKIMKKFGKNFREHVKEEKEAIRDQKSETVEKINDIHIKSAGG